MNNKKIQANMQIDISFIGNTSKLVKQLESEVGRLNLNSTIGSKLTTGLEKSFKEVYSNLDKMAEGLSKKGLSPKQYTAFFSGMHEKLQTSIKFTQTLKDDLQNLFNSAENKKALKDLDEFKNKLEAINKLASSQKGAATRQQTTMNKMKEETGLDYNVSKQMLQAISKRRANKMVPTKAQQEWMDANGLNEEKLKRALELSRQIAAQAQKISNLNAEAKKITGQSTVGSSQKDLE